MKLLFTILFFCSINCLAQGPKDAQYTVKSIEDVADFKGVYMTLNLQVEDRFSDNHTVAYYLKDRRDKPILVSMSDKKGQINLHISSLKHIRYIYIGGLGHITTRIDLDPFKGKRSVLEMSVELDLRPLH